MTSTYGPRVTFDLPSGSASAQRIASTAGLDQQETARWSKREGEAPDDVRAAIEDALRVEYGGWVDVWPLLPRRVEYGPARLEVELAVVEDEYPDDGPEVQPSPRQRLLETLRHYHEDLHANEVAVSDLLAETEGDVDTLRQELERLERQGFVYERTQGYVRRTPSVESEG